MPTQEEIIQIRQSNPKIDQLMEKTKTELLEIAKIKKIPMSPSNSKIHIACDIVNFDPERFRKTWRAISGS